MRLQRITTNYPTYLRQFYAGRPQLIERPYAAQHAALMLNACGWADFWSLALCKVGYECDEVVSNAEPMQKSWAREHGVAFDGGNWLQEITTAQVKAFKPDVLFVNDYVTFSASYLRHLKAECPSMRLVLGWCGAPYSDASVFREYDIVLSSVPELVRDFLAQGHRCFQINHAFEPRVLERIDLDAPPATDFAFVGSITKKDNFHREREEQLVKLINKTDLQIWAAVNQPSLPERTSVRLKQFAYDVIQAARDIGLPASFINATPFARKVARWQARPQLPQAIDTRIERRAQPPLFGLAMFQQLRQSKVVLNTHIDISSSHASNMRLYEATGVGSCLLSDWKANLSELFEPDREVLTYRSIDECVEKLRYVLAHEGERRAIAIAGQARTLRDHTFDRRAAQLDELLQREMHVAAASV